MEDSPNNRLEYESYKSKYDSQPTVYSDFYYGENIEDLQIYYKAYYGKIPSFEEKWFNCTEGCKTYYTYYNDYTGSSYVLT